MAHISNNKRRYNSKRRTESAQKTRQEIVDAALRLHARGISTLGAVAQEAGVSLPTVYKYFPTRDDLFRACTSYSKSVIPAPPLAALARIDDPAERLYETVREVYAFHQVLLGFVWTAYSLERESPVLSGVLAEIDQLVGAAADVILAARKTGVSPPEVETTKGFVCGMLSPLAYRALRVKGGLDAEQATRQAAQALGKILGIDLRSILTKTLS